MKPGNIYSLAWPKPVRLSLSLDEKTSQDLNLTAMAPHDITCLPLELACLNLM